jgi:hypothetical protein
MTNNQRTVVFSIGLLLVINTLSAQVRDSSATRLFFQANTAFRHMNLKAFTQWLAFEGPFNKPMQNATEISVYSGLIMGKNKEGFLKVGFSYIPDLRRNQTTTYTSKYHGDSVIVTNFFLHDDLFKIRSYTLEGGYFYTIGKIKTEIGFGLSLNSIQRLLTNSQYLIVNVVDNDGSMHSYKSDLAPNTPEGGWVRNFGGGGLFTTAAGYALNKHLTLTAELHFYLAAIQIRDRDGNAIVHYSPSPLGYVEQNVWANMSGFSVGSGVIYKL